MAIDQTVIGTMAADIMDHAEAQHGEGATIKLAGLVLAVQEGSETKYHWQFRPEGLPHEAVGLLTYVAARLSGPPPRG